MFAFSSDENVSGSACHRMIAWCYGNSPKVVVIVCLLNACKRDAAKYLDAKDESKEYTEVSWSKENIEIIEQLQKEDTT